VAKGTTDKFTEKIIKGEIRNTDVQYRLARAIAENPGAADDYLKADYRGKTEIQAQVMLDTISPTINHQIWDLTTAIEGMSSTAKSLTRRLKDYPHAHMGAKRDLLLKDLKALKQALESWHPEL
jgi:predicted phage-related endonuclease